MPKCVTYNGNCLSLGYPRPPCPRLSKNSIGFTEVEIKNNIEVFRRASELLPDLLSELALLKGKSRDKNNPKGWIIRALEGKVKDLLEKIEKDGMSREILAIADKLGKK